MDRDLLSASKVWLSFLIRLYCYRRRYRVLDRGQTEQQVRVEEMEEVVGQRPGRSVRSLSSARLTFRGVKVLLNFSSVPILALRHHGRGLPALLCFYTASSAPILANGTFREFSQQLFCSILYFFESQRGTDKRAKGTEASTSFFVWPRSAPPREAAQRAAR